MTYVRSFSLIERDLMHHYRDQLNHAESEEDVKKFFARTVQRLLNGILDGTIKAEDTDAALKTDNPPYFEISDRLATNKTFQAIQQNSDLTAVLRRFAEPAVKHHQHLRGHPEKTRAKIRHHS